ncbi:hypothetical protein [Roseivirga sp.]|uniref:hypothetical protein n=1 Tax=Roseivirga sp. TaxID=1964215 RepID=UPI003B8CAAC1
MNRIKLFFTFALIGTISACTGEGTNTSVGESSYFDLQTLLDSQVEYLTSSEAKLKKELTAQGAKENLTIDPDSVQGWKRQLKLFYEANINKKGFEGEYFEEHLPVINGLSKSIFTAKTQKNPVKVLECTYENDTLKEIRVSVKESNTVYEVSKEMTLHFNSEQHLVGFDIKGGETMAVKKDLNYSIVGTIIY